jgi:ketosteroid isomerase-like protein
MKGILAAVVLVLAVACQAFAQAKPAPAPSASVQKELIKLENDWNNALVKRDVAALSRILADDWTTIVPDDGTIMTKAQALANLKSGEDAYTSAIGDEWKVRVYGDAAVVLQRWTTKEQYKGKDVSGQYGFTDTWIKKDGRWQCVASAGTKITKK